MAGSTHVAVGDVDLRHVGALLADGARCRILLALFDGRALPATVLAMEAGVAPSTASGHLKLLTEAGLLRAEKHGRNRYYRLGGPETAEFLEAAARLAPLRPITSLRDGTRANALRTARTCYDHLAGRLGVAMMRSLLDRGYLTGHDGTFDPDVARADRLSARGRDHDYRVTREGCDFLRRLDVDVPVGSPVSYCVDWSEQRHHLSGSLGRQLLGRLLDLGWVQRTSADRSLRISMAGLEGLATVFDLPERCWRPAPT